MIPAAPALATLKLEGTMAKAVTDALGVISRATIISGLPAATSIK